MLLTRSDDLIDPFFHPATANRFACPLAAAIIDDLRPMLLDIAPYGRTLQPHPLDQGPARGTLAAYVPRLITSPSS